MAPAAEPLSQLRLASGAAVSTRHLSFIETGRSRPSREMILYLADRLEVPLRERNRLLLAGGYAPAYGERPLESDEMAAVRGALERVLAAHEPYPALVLDRRWNLVLANGPVGLMTEGIAAELLEPPANALRATLHPDGLAPRIVNLGEWSVHLLHRLRREIEATADDEAPRPPRRAPDLSGDPGAAAGSRACRPGRHRASARASARRRHAVLLQHGDDVRDAERRHARRALARGLLSGRYRDRVLPRDDAGVRPRSGAGDGDAGLGRGYSASIVEPARGRPRGRAEVARCRESHCPRSRARAGRSSPAAPRPARRRPLGEARFRSRGRATDRRRRCCLPRRRAPARRGRGGRSRSRSAPPRRRAGEASPRSDVDAARPDHLLGPSRARARRRRGGWRSRSSSRRPSASRRRARGESACRRRRVPRRAGS